LTWLLRAYEARCEPRAVGTPWSDVDRAARDVIDRGGYGADFPHITGHGVGFCYHEITPLIGRDCGKRRGGQIVTIEPAMYRADVGGVRHEDNCLSRKRGWKISARSHAGFLPLPCAGSRAAEVEGPGEG
jgi:Xaa-Pro aminopeptidase